MPWFESEIVPLIMPVCVTALALLGFWALGCYNRLQALRFAAWQDMQRCLQAWQERNLATANVLHLLDAYVQHERAALALVDAALQAHAQASATVRVNALQPSTLQELAVREGQLAQQIAQLRQLCVEYADLKVNPQLIGLWARHAAVEDTCTYLLRAYNNAAQRFNLAAAQTPASWVARGLRLVPCMLVHPLAAQPVTQATNQSTQLQLL